MTRPRRRERGASVVELAIAMVILVLAVGVVVGLVGVTRSGTATVRRETDASRALRDAADRISADLRQTAASRLVVETLPDQNHRVTLQQPVGVSAGAVSWGVRDPALGEDEATRARAGWFVRYTVRAADPGATAGRELVRQIVDDASTVRHETVLLRRVPDGNGALPGFRVTPSGELWNVTIGVRGGDAGGPLRGLSYDVALMN